MSDDFSYTQVYRVNKKYIEYYDESQNKHYQVPTDLNKLIRLRHEMIGNLTERETNLLRAIFEAEEKLMIEQAKNK